MEDVPRDIIEGVTEMKFPLWDRAVLYKKKKVRSTPRYARLLFADRRRPKENETDRTSNTFQWIWFIIAPNRKRDV